MECLTHSEVQLWQQKSDTCPCPRGSYIHLLVFSASFYGIILNDKEAKGHLHAGTASTKTHSPTGTEPCCSNGVHHESQPQQWMHCVQSPGPCLGTPQRTRKEMVPETGPETRLQWLRSKEKTRPETCFLMTS